MKWEKSPITVIIWGQSKPSFGTNTSIDSKYWQNLVNIIYNKASLSSLNHTASDCKPYFLNLLLQIHIWVPQNLNKILQAKSKLASLSVLALHKLEKLIEHINILRSY